MAYPVHTYEVYRNGTFVELFKIDCPSASSAKCVYSNRNKIPFVELKLKKVD